MAVPLAVEKPARLAAHRAPRAAPLHAPPLAALHSRFAPQQPSRQPPAAMARLAYCFEEVRRGQGPLGPQRQRRQPLAPCTLMPRVLQLLKARLAPQHPPCSRPRPGTDASAPDRMPTPQVFMWHDPGSTQNVRKGFQPTNHFESAESKRRLNNLLDFSGGCMLMCVCVCSCYCVLVCGVVRCPTLNLQSGSGGSIP